jgi:hypothetical protein
MLSDARAAGVTRDGDTGSGGRTPPTELDVSDASGAAVDFRGVSVLYWVTIAPLREVRGMYRSYVCIMPRARRRAACVDAASRAVEACSGGGGGSACNASTAAVSCIGTIGGRATLMIDVRGGRRRNVCLGIGRARLDIVSYDYHSLQRPHLRAALLILTGSAVFTGVRLFYVLWDRCVTREVASAAGHENHGRGSGGKLRLRGCGGRFCVHRDRCVDTQIAKSGGG